MTNFEKHEFYCVNCAHKGLPVWRTSASQRGKGHLKKLYCINCRREYNHYECYDEKDVAKFFLKFERGDFKDKI